MDFLEVVKKRKSIRRFKPKEVEEEKIKEILNVVRQAPSAGNLQAYKIFVLKTKEARLKFFAASYGQSWIKDASVLFIFCADSFSSSQRYGPRGQLYALQDATIAAAYGQLAITNLGLASVWVGTFDEKKIQAVLKTSLVPTAILAVGYPDEDPVRPVKKEVEEIAEII